MLCSDKTGTLTDGTVRLQSAPGADGQPSDRVFLYAYLNASFESGFINPIDEAIRAYRSIDVAGYVKLDEHPYDFIRKRLSIMLLEAQKQALIGSFDFNSADKLLYCTDELLSICGISRGDFTGTPDPITALINADDLSNLRLLILKALAEQSNTEADCRLRHSDGEELTLHVKLTPLIDNRAENLHIIGTAQDITKRMRMIELCHLSY